MPKLPQIKPNLLVKLAVLIILTLTGAGYFLFQNLNKPSPQQARNAEILSLVKEIGQYMELPKENPTLATITDITKLSDQAFFTKAQNGDKVLIFPQAKLGVLYNPKNHKILNIAPVSSQSETSQSTHTPGVNQGETSHTPGVNGHLPGVTTEVKVIILNGTTINRLTYKVEEKWKKTYPKITITTRDNAQSDTYEKTAVVVLNNNFSEFGNNLAKLLNAQVTSLPEGETVPAKADILILAGLDQG